MQSDFPVLSHLSFLAVKRVTKRGRGKHNKLYAGFGSGVSTDKPQRRWCIFPEDLPSVTGDDARTCTAPYQPNILLR